MLEAGADWHPQPREPRANVTLYGASHSRFLIASTASCRRLLALEARIDAELELGAGAELVGELERLVSAHPFRERLAQPTTLGLKVRGDCCFSLPIRGRSGAGCGLLWRFRDHSPLPV
jgi:hypothetical protein